MSTVTQEPTLGELVDAWRMHAGLSKRKLAKLAGCSQPYVVQITRGERKDVRMVKLVKIARACGWPVEEARGLATDYDPDVHGDARAASLPPDASSIDTPGWMCLPSISAVSVAARRTLVPIFSRPLAHPA